MKHLLLTVLAAATAISVNAAPKRLASIIEVEQWMDITDPIDKFMYTTFFHYNDEGRLFRVSEGNSCVTISYDDLAAGKLKLTSESGDDGQHDVYDVTLDADGRVATAILDNRDGKFEYTFGYTDGMLTSVIEKQTYEGVSSTNNTAIEYADGNISTVTITDSEYPDEVEISTFTYGDVANKGALRLYDDLFGMDIDDLQYLAQAGFMGNAPSKLPASITLKDSEGTQSEKVLWTLDTDGYPTRLGNEYSTQDYTELTWESDPSGIDDITADDSEGTEYYNLQGLRIDRPESGIVIVRYPDGRTAKQLIK